MQANDITLKYRISDPYDATIRLLNDAQRLGLELVGLRFAESEQTLVLTVRAPGTVDLPNLADRLARHRTIVAMPAGAAS